MSLGSGHIIIDNINWDITNSTTPSDVINKAKRFVGGLIGNAGGVTPTIFAQQTISPSWWVPRKSGSQVSGTSLSIYANCALDYSISSVSAFPAILTIIGRGTECGKPLPMLNISINGIQIASSSFTTALKTIQIPIQILQLQTTLLTIAFVNDKYINITCDTNLIITKVTIETTHIATSYGQCGSSLHTSESEFVSSATKLCSHSFIVLAFFAFLLMHNYHLLKHTI